MQQVLITLTDVNDNIPVISSSTITSTSIMENTSPSSIVTVITATDADTGVNGALTYSIISGNTNGIYDAYRWLDAIVYLILNYVLYY